MKLFTPPGAPSWLDPILRRIRQGLGEPWDSPLRLQRFTVTTLPAAADWPDGLIIITNETGGLTVAFSDGTNWRRVQDRAIAS